LEESHYELVKAYDMTLKGWSNALELRDHDTEQHIQRVTQETIALAWEIGVLEEEIVGNR
jgi:hypothetical protein